MATRILPAEHGALPATLQTFLARIGKTGVPPLSLFLTLGQSARAWAKFSAGSLLDEDSPLSLRERELVINRTCALTRCEYEWGVHVWMFAAAAGLSRGDVAGTLERTIDPSRWSDAEQALLELLAQALRLLLTLVRSRKTFTAKAESLLALLLQALRLVSTSVEFFCLVSESSKPQLRIKSPVSLFGWPGFSYS